MASNGIERKPALAFERFLQRRSNPGQVPVRIPKGHPDCASLEMLSDLALREIKSSSMLVDSSTTPAPYSVGSMDRCNNFETSSSLSSPVSLYALQDSSFGEQKTGSESRGSYVPIARKASSESERTPYLQHATPVSPADPQRVDHRGSRISKRNPVNTQTPTKSRCQSSRFCHICSRTTRKVKNMCCANFYKGSCRKVICQKCFEEYGWDWEGASANPMSWLCTHCQGACPSRAQCAIYQRTNERRREHQQRLKLGSMPDRSQNGSGAEGNSLHLGQPHHVTGGSLQNPILSHVPTTRLQGVPYFQGAPSNQ